MTIATGMFCATRLVLQPVQPGAVAGAGHVEVLLGQRAEHER